MGKSDFDSLTVAAFESRLAVEMENLIRRHGGQPLVAPALKEIPLEDNRDVLRFGERLLAGEIDMVILLTGVGTKTMVEVLQTRHSLDTITSALKKVSLVVRGPKPIAALKALGLTPTLTVPEPNTWRDIIHTLDMSKPVKGLRLAVQEYGISNTEFLEELKARGARVTRVPVYRWALPEDIEPLRHALDAMMAGQVGVVLITNAAQVDHVMQVLQKDQADRFRQALKKTAVASIGPTASERLRHHGWPVDLEPSHPKMGILVKEASEQAGSILKKNRSA